MKQALVGFLALHSNLLLDARQTQHETIFILLGEAINSILTVKQKSDIDNFMGGMQGSLLTEPITGLDDFELICFLVIK